MKKLSDYTGAEAFELWADLMEPIVRILQDPDVVMMFRSRASRFKLVSEVLKTHKDEMMEIFNRIDPDDPVNGLTVVLRTTQLLAEIGNSEVIDSFFGSDEQETEA
ncbi:MAG: hypothetical protein J6P49_04085 [Paludibacteraceae bacterium]|nr:hypothetical protein [Paludibacteraceae bacterium]MBO7379943.1 hypothetical protein [Bacteroidales bacterium]MBP5311906.1 hypothetical protein [Clostridia bacterium]